MSEVFSNKYYVYISSSWVQLLDIASASMNWGLNGNDRVADVDELNITLNNSDHRYTPGAPSALAGWDEGLRVRLDMTYDSVTYARFHGRIAGIKIASRPGDVKANVTVLGWMDNAVRYDVILPPLLENATIDEGIDDILADVPVQPLAQDIAIGGFIFDRLFDDTRDKTKAYTEIVKFINSEFGRAYIRHDGTDGETFVVESLETRNGTRTLAQVDGGDAPTFDASVMTQKDVSHGQDVINNYTISAYPKKIDDNPSLIYESEESVFLQGGQEKTLRVFWTDSDGRRSINAVPPSSPGYDVSVCNTMEMFGAGQATTSGYFYGTFQDETGKVWDIKDAPFIDFPVYGKGSAYFDGTDAWLESADSPDWDFGSGDFWIRFRVYAYGVDANQPIIARSDAAFPPFVIKSDGTNYKLYLSSAGASFDILNGLSLGSIEPEVWHTYAVGRRGNTAYSFKDGAAVSSAAAGGTIQASSSVLYIGRNNSNYFGGNLTEWNIKKGYCPYIASFTEPETIVYMSEGAYFEMNTAQDFTGTNVKDLLTTSVTYGTEGAEFVLTSSHTDEAWVKIKVYGRGIYSNSSLQANVRDETSITARGEKSYSISQAYQVTTELGELEAEKVVELWRNPRTVLKGFSYCPNISDEFMQAFLSLDVGDLIPAEITTDGIDAYYYINSVSARMSAGGIVLATYGLEQAWTIEKGLSFVACEFASGTDAIVYKYNPIIQADAVTDRAFSAWVWLDAVTATRDQGIISVGGVTVYIDSNVSNVVVSLNSNRFTTSGKWVSPTNPFAVGGWHHVALRYDHSSASNDPTCRIDGVSITMTEGTTPSGTAVSERGNNISIGNIKRPSSNLVKAFDGKITDVRIFNMDEVTVPFATLAQALYNAGIGGTANTEGVKFMSPCIRTEDETAFTDLTLTTEKILDGYLGYVGTPSGSPIVRI